VAVDLRKVDKAFPIIVRFVGLVTTVVLIGFSLAGYYVQAAPGFVAAAGMLLYKYVHDAADENQGGEKTQNEKDLSDW
jgi:hypothetical protein